MRPTDSRSSPPTAYSVVQSALRNKLPPQVSQQPAPLLASAESCFPWLRAQGYFVAMVIHNSPF